MEKTNRIKSLGIQKHRALLINNQNTVSHSHSRYYSLLRQKAWAATHSSHRGCMTVALRLIHESPTSPMLLQDHEVLIFQNRSLLKGLGRPMPTSLKCCQWMYSTWDIIQKWVDGIQKWVFQHAELSDFIIGSSIFYWPKRDCRYRPLAVSSEASSQSNFPGWPDPMGEEKKLNTFQEAAAFDCVFHVARKGSQ